MASFVNSWVFVALVVASGLINGCFSCDGVSCLTISNLANIEIFDTHTIDFNGEWEYSHCGTRYGSTGQPVYSREIEMCCWDQTWYLTYNLNSRAWVIVAQDWYNSGYANCYEENFEDCTEWTYYVDAYFLTDYSVSTSCCGGDCSNAAGSSSTSEGLALISSSDESDINGNCDYYECLVTKDFNDNELNTYWEPIGCYNGEGYYLDVTSDGVSGNYLFYDNSNSVWMINNIMSEANISLELSDVAAYCDQQDESDVKECGTQDWSVGGTADNNGEVTEEDEDTCEEGRIEAGTAGASVSSAAAATADSCANSDSGTPDCIEISNLDTVNYGNTHYMDMNGNWEFSHCGERYGATGQAVYTKSVEMASWTQEWTLVYNTNSGIWNIAAQDYYSIGVAYCTQSNINSCDGRWTYLDGGYWKQSIGSSSSDTSCTSRGSRNSNSNNNNSDGDIEWYVWLLIVLCLLLGVSLIGVIIYYQKKYSKPYDNYKSKEKQAPLLTKETPIATATATTTAEQ